MTGDIRSHIFRIDMTQTDQFTSDGKFAFPYITKEFACLTCHNGVTASDHSNIDETDFVFHEPPSTTAAYIGTHHCQTCHPTIYSSFIESGHNFKLNKIEGGAEPTYPVFTPGITGALALIDDDDTESGDPKAGTDNTLGTPASYSDVSYVIGGYNWKARFVDADGYIVTGTKVQYNLETGAMGGYHNNETDKPYNCGNCHTTGWKHFDAANNQSRQGGLAGMDGTWMMEGVQCESCHGAASLHVNSGNKDDITRVATARTTADFLAPDMAFGLPVACSECHTRDGEKDDPSYTSAFTTASGLDIPGGRIAAVGNLIRHHEQFDELLGVDPDTPAAGSTRSGAFSTAKLGCTGCHDPHKTSVYDSDTDGMLDGVDNSNAGCLTAGCHDASTYDPVNANTINMTGLNCIDCHMPFLAKSAISVPAEGTGPVTGDIRSHIFRIDMTQTDQFTSDGKFAYPYLTKAFACLTCHNGVDASDRSGQDDTNYVFHPAAP
ncbi:MAG: hypothetical protein GTN70_03785 [Deltaproteobacteria bacterium]|nr:hypothetical protein [Deltaproteobacteria bacterium]NIS76773.1 hypothetical protein [Deltaproteobacteria bacterium]